MKGIIIYGSPEGAITFCEFVNEASYELKNIYGSQEFTSCLKGEASKCSKAKCSKEDTYDFETGALIALMKMCGRDKVIKACDELYKDDNYKNALQEMIENCEKLMEEKDKLQHDYDLCENSENALKYTVDSLNKSVNKLNKAIYGYKNDLYNTAKRCKELKEENEKLKLDCEKLQHGYNKMLYKIPTKRDEMWENIINASQDPPVDIKVAKQDIKTFLKELQDKIPEAMWNGPDDCLPTEYTNPNWFKYDYIYFALFRHDDDDKGKLRICYAVHKQSWINKPVIDYLPPMRWDLFKKGRIAVRLTKDNYKEFYDICEKELGRSPSYKPDEFAYAPMEKFVLRYDKKFKGYIFLGSTESKKIVNWEDVR